MTATRMWVAVELSTGLFGARTVFVPLARLKEEGGQLLVPYSKQRLKAREVEDGDGISAECDRVLRDYYGIDTGDQEMRADNKSYAVRVSEEGGAAASSFMRASRCSRRQTPRHAPTNRAAPRGPRQLRDAQGDPRRRMCPTTTRKSRG